MVKKNKMKNKRTTRTIVFASIFVVALIVLLIVSISSSIEKRDKEDDGRNFFFVENETINEETGEIEIESFPNIVNIILVAGFMVVAWRMFGGLRNRW